MPVPQNERDPRITRRELFQKVGEKTVAITGLAVAVSLLIDNDRVYAQAPIAREPEAAKDDDVFGAIERSQKLDPNKKAQFRDDLEHLNRRLAGDGQWLDGSRWARPTHGLLYTKGQEQTKPTEVKGVSEGYEARVEVIAKLPVVQSMTMDPQGNVYMAGSQPSHLEANTRATFSLRLPPGYTRATSFATNPNSHGESTIAAVRYDERKQPHVDIFVGRFDAHKHQFDPEDHSLDTRGRNYTTVTYIRDDTLLLTSWYPTYNEQLGILEYPAALYDTRTKQLTYVGSLDEPIEGAASPDGETINIVSYKGLYSFNRRHPQLADKPEIEGNFSSILFMRDEQSGQMTRVLGGLEGVMYGERFFELRGDDDRVNMVHGLLALSGQVMITHRKGVHMLDPRATEPRPVHGNDRNLKEATYAAVKLLEQSETAHRVLTGGTWEVVELSIEKQPLNNRRSIRN